MGGSLCARGNICAYELPEILKSTLRPLSDHPTSPPVHHQETTMTEADIGRILGVLAVGIVLYLVKRKFFS